MGFFGSGDKKTRVNTNIDEERQNVSLNQVSGPAVITKGDVTLTYTDQGAVHGGLALANSALTGALDYGGAVAKTAFDFGNNALELSDRSAQRVLVAGDRAFKFATDVQRQADESQRDALKEVSDTSTSALSYVDAANRSDLARNFDQLIKWGGIAAVVLAVAFMMRGQ